MEILTKLSPVLYAFTVGASLYVLIYGFIKSEQVKIIIAKILMVLVFSAMVKKPELFGIFGETIINLITTIIGYFA